MKTAGFFSLVAIVAGAVACVAPGPTPNDSAEEPEERTAEAQSEIVYCISSCGCSLGYFCYVPAGHWYGSCIQDMAGPTAPVCFDSCQCPTGQLCGPAMVCETPVCFSDYDCGAGLRCSDGQCIDDSFYLPW